MPFAHDLHNCEDLANLAVDCRLQVHKSLLRYDFPLHLYKEFLNTSVDDHFCLFLEHVLLKNVH